MYAAALYPNATREEVQAETGWDIEFADDLETTPESKAEELRLIHEDLDPDEMYTNQPSKRNPQFGELPTARSQSRHGRSVILIPARSLVVLNASSYSSSGNDGPSAGERSMFFAIAIARRQLES